MFRILTQKYPVTLKRLVKDKINFNLDEQVEQVVFLAARPYLQA